MAEQYESESTDEDGEPQSLFLTLQGWVKDDRRANSSWYVEAKKDYGFKSGGDSQWEPADVSRLREQDRPHTTFNFIGPSVNSVAGMEVSNRQEVTYLPRTTQSSDTTPSDPQTAVAQLDNAIALHEGHMSGSVPTSMESQQQMMGMMMTARQALGNSPAPGADDTGPAEMFTAAGQYFRDQCDAEDEESDAFQDCATCGVGFTETRVDFEEDPEGKMIVDRCDPLEMGWDHRASKRNMVDSRRFHRVREMDKRTALEMFPGYDCDEIDAAWARPQTIDTEPHDREEAGNYENDLSRTQEKNTVHVVEITWFDRISKYRIANLDTGEVMEDVSREQLKTIRERAKEAEIRIAVHTVQQRVYRQAFLGSTTILGDDQEGTPCQSQKGFRFNAITGTRDRNQRQWVGIVRAMRDPQRWTNALYSSVLNTIMTSGKGVMAERDAFENPATAEADWAKSGKITFLKTGALSGQNPKITQKVPANLPPAILEMMQFAMQSLRDVSGVNIETLGLADREQAASLEYQRRQAATTILAPFFDGLRRYRKEQGRIMLDLIKNYLSDGRLIRIVGSDYEKYIPLLKDDSVTEFDIIVGQSPTSPNQKEASWMTLQQIIPVIGGAQGLGPRAIGTLLKASPLPTTVIDDFQKAAQQERQEAQNAPPPPEVQKTMAETRKVEIESALKEQELQQRGVEMQMNLETTRMDMEDRQAERADRGVQRQHDMQMRQMEFQGAADTEFAKSAGPGMPAKFDALGQGLMALAQAITAQGQATSDAMTQLAQLVAAPRQTTLQFNGDMPVGAISTIERVQ